MPSTQEQEDSNIQGSEGPGNQATEDDIQAVSSESQDLQTDVDEDLLSSNRQLKEEVTQLKKERDNFKQEVDQLLQERKDLQSSLAHTQDQCAKLESDLEHLQTIEAGRSNESQPQKSTNDYPDELASKAPRVRRTRLRANAEESQATARHQSW